MTDRVADDQARIFISYAREDLGLARQINRDLRQRGYVTWIDFERLIAGEVWKDAIGNAIKNSGYFLFLMSSKSLNKRGFVQKELRQALDVLEYLPAGSIFLIPVRCDECHPTDPVLCDRHWVDLFPSYENGFEELLRAFAPPEKAPLFPYCIIAEMLGQNSKWCCRITELPITFGRSADCGVPVPSNGASKRHAMLYLDAGEVFLSDLASTNGTFVAESRIVDKVSLEKEQSVNVKFGDIEFRLTYSRVDSQLAGTVVTNMITGQMIRSYSEEGLTIPGSKSEALDSNYSELDFAEIMKGIGGEQKTAYNIPQPVLEKAKAKGDDDEEA